MIAVVDYGAGNLASVVNALTRLGVPVEVTRDREVILAAAGVIVPGVGAACDTMAHLDGLGLSPVIQEVVAAGTPYLGICMGMQALLTRSLEGGEHPLFAGIPDGADFYFVHSYYVDPSDEAWVGARTEYGVAFASALARGNLMGTQFHPEKSGRWGLRLLANFAAIVALVPASAGPAPC